METENKDQELETASATLAEGMHCYRISVEAAMRNAGRFIVESKP